MGTTTIFTIGTEATFPVYNLVPHPGLPAEFGFIVLIDPVHAYATIRSGGEATGSTSTSTASPRAWA